MMNEGDEKIQESKTLKQKGEKIIREKQRYAEKIENRIAEGDLITKEGNKLVRIGEKIIEEESRPEKDGGARNIIMGKRLQQVGRKRIEDYKVELEKTERWINEGEDFIKAGQHIEAEGNMLKKHGKQLVRDTGNNGDH